MKLYAFVIGLLVSYCWSFSAWGRSPEIKIDEIQISQQDQINLYSPNHPLAKNNVVDQEQKGTCDGADADVPIAVQKEVDEFLENNSSTACRNSSDKLVCMRKRDGKYVYRTDIVAPTDDMLKEYGDVVRDFRSFCLRSKEDIAKMLKANGSSIPGNLGYLMAEDATSPWCSATRVGRFVITARHCFVRSDSRVVDVPDSMRFVHFSDPKNAWKLSVSKKIHGDPGQLELSSPEDDWLVLKLIGYSEDMFEDLKLGTVSQWDKLVLVGIDTEMILLRTIERALHGRSDRSDSDHSFPPRFEFGPLCRGALVEGGLVFHSCQTDMGMSGSPIFFEQRDGTLAFAGVHVGGAGDLSSTCAKKLVKQRGAPNYGVQIPRYAIDRIRSLLDRPLDVSDGGAHVVPTVLK